MRLPFLAALLIPLLSTAQAEPASAQTARTERAWSYDKRIQLYEVPVNIRSPEELEREQNRKQQNEKVREADDVFTAEAPATLPTPPPTQRRRKAEEEDEDAKKSRDWLRVGDDAKETDKKKPSGWGWLADDSRKISDSRSAQRAPEQDDADERESSATGSIAQINANWHAPSSSARSESEIARPGADRTTARLSRRTESVADPSAAGLGRPERSLPTAPVPPAPERARWLPDLASSGIASRPMERIDRARGWQSGSPELLAGPERSMGGNSWSGFRPVDLGTAIQGPTSLGGFDNARPLFPAAAPSVPDASMNPSVLNPSRPGSADRWGSSPADAGRNGTLPW